MLASKHKFQTGVFLQCSYCCLTFWMYVIEQEARKSDEFIYFA